MELGQYQMQIFLSLVVILGAALVALICDLLKGNNEQLRELALELKVRREEEHRRFQILAPRVLAEATAGGPASALSGALTEAPAASLAERAAPPAQKIQAAPETAAERAEPKQKRQRDPNRRALAPEALAAIERGLELAAAPRPRRTPTMPAEPEPVVAEAAPEKEYAAAPAFTTPAFSTREAAQPMVEPVVEVLPAAVAGSGSAPVGRGRDWGQLLNVRRGSAPLTTPTRKVQEPAIAASAETALPAGFQDGFVLSRLVESRQPVSGLVVSIGANSIPGAFQNQDTAISAKVRTLIQSLLGPGDFAAQSGSDEFLLIYPGERGAQAQRKLSQIAEQLWDFQLRSLGTLSIQFSWGGVEVRSESIDEAIASATERMQETRRGRKVLTMGLRNEAGAPLRKAV